MKLYLSLKIIYLFVFISIYNGLKLIIFKLFLKSGFKISSNSSFKLINYVYN